MANFSVGITVPDDKVDDLVAALRHQWFYGEDVTVSQIRVELKRRVEEQLRTAYREHMRRQIKPEIDIT